jgi:TonB family protein
MSRQGDLNRVFLMAGLVLLCLVEVLGATTAQSKAAAQISPAERLQRAADAINEGRLANAADELKRVLAVDKGNARANYLKAIICQKREELENASKYVNRALKKDPTLADAHLLRAVLQYHKFELKKALADVEAAITLGAKQASVLELKGYLQLCLGETQNGLDAFREALRLYDPLESVELQQTVSALESFLNWKNEKVPRHVMPIPLNNPYPRYTEVARRNKVQGRLAVLAMIDEVGSVSATRLVWRVGYGLDEEALRTVSKLKFKPATADGKPEQAWLLVQVDFNLR